MRNQRSQGFNQAPTTSSADSLGELGKGDEERRGRLVLLILVHNDLINFTAILKSARSDGAELLGNLWEGIEKRGGRLVLLALVHNDLMKFIAISSGSTNE